jgi:flagellar export protein FliJ
MADFRFRAEAALALRRREEEEAAAAFGRAQAAFAVLAERRARAVADREAALAAPADLQRAGTDAATIEWHWNWITRLAATVERLGRDVEAQRAVVATAERGWYDARRRRLALERMRQHALRRFLRTQSREEQKTLDELARIRFVMPDPTLTRED